MNETVSEDEAIAPEQGGRIGLFRLGFLVAVGRMDPGAGPREPAEGASSTTRSYQWGDHLETQSFRPIESPHTLKN